ncbi:MAG: ATP-binding protein [Bacteroidales bacterium]|jgi:predicted ATPase|nr:ATP-binding protein [Bacteroidales bacterium]
MASIIIRNIGPIKEASFNLNKINVFIGPQSSGKSTIAKIISYCTWVEKDVATSQSLKAYQENDNYFKERLESYHKLKGYFRSDSFIEYISDVISLSYSQGKLEISWKDRYAYKRSKISYIPSERNIIVLPEMEKIEFPNNSIRSFLFDWFDARKNYSKEKNLHVLSLDVDYYYNENNQENHILGKDGHNVLLSNASSGLQSVTPLVVMIDYLNRWIYDKDETLSFEINEKTMQADKILTDELVFKPYYKDTYNEVNTEKKYYDNINEKIRQRDKEVLALVANWDRKRKELFSTHNSQFIIEEPEQNLFPETQRDLVYHLLEKCFNKEGNRLTITTHSPYVLYALNNCMLGNLVSDRMDDEDKNSIACTSALISPNEVSIYQINGGRLENIQQSDGLIGSNYFDEKMKDIMDDFYTLLKYYDDAE